MAVATVYGVLQMLVLGWVTRSVRMSTVLLSVAVGVYGSGVLAAMVEFVYTRCVAGVTGEPLIVAVNAASYGVDPAVEELAKVTPLLLLVFNRSVRSRLGLTDYLVLGAGLGGGFGLLEPLVRYGLDAHLAVAQPEGGWTVPVSLFPPYVPGPRQVFASWLPDPAGAFDTAGGVVQVGVNQHLVWTVVAALGVGWLWRASGWRRVWAVVPIAAAIADHTLDNYTALHAYGTVQSVSETIDGWLWAGPLAALAAAVVLDVRHGVRGRRMMPEVLLAAERAGRPAMRVLAGYGAWCLPWSALIALRFAQVRRSLLFAAELAPADDVEDLRRVVAFMARRIDASDREEQWRGLHLRSALRGPGRMSWWLVIVSWALAVPSILLLAVGCFPTTAGIQASLGSGVWPEVISGFGLAGLVLVGWRLAVLLRTWRDTRAHPVGEVLLAVRLRLWTAVGTATAGVVLMWHGLGTVGAKAGLISNFHLLAALGDFLVYFGFALILLSLLVLFPPSGLVLAGGGLLAGALSTEAAVTAGGLGLSGALLMAVGATSGGGTDGGGWDPPASNDAGQPSDSSGAGHGHIDESQKTFNAKERRIADLLKSEGKNVKALKESDVDGVKTPDAEVDGVRTEFKTLDDGAQSNSVKNILNKAKKQAADAVVDARGTGLSEEDAITGMHNFLRNNPPGRMHAIRIIGDGYDIEWP
jgi:hypothetical protein